MTARLPSTTTSPGVGSIGFPIEVVIASTWSQELANEWGSCMGKMSREMGAHGWYAPGMNTQDALRSAQLVSIFRGRRAGGTDRGQRGGRCNGPGRIFLIKHFALYEGNGKMVSVWSNEQAIREIYLKPLEISVKEGRANAVMVSWSF